MYLCGIENTFHEKSPDFWYFLKKCVWTNFTVRLSIKLRICALKVNFCASDPKLMTYVTYDIVTYDNYDTLMALYSLYRYPKSSGNNKEIDNCFYFTFFLSLLTSWQRKSQRSFSLLMARTNKTYKVRRTINVVIGIPGFWFPTIYRCPLATILFWKHTEV